MNEKPARVKNWKEFLPERDEKPMEGRVLISPKPSFFIHPVYLGRQNE